MINRIATVAVYVKDQQKAKAFWTEKAGFEVKAEHPMGPGMYWLEVAPPQAETCLVIYPEGMMEDVESKNASLVFDCENIQVTYTTMKQNGVVFKGEPKAMQWGTFVQFQDEDGHEFVLRQPS
ncbi:VOC family protein [Marinicrinis sediminis]|uniref:VOC family protein n=1 Tax=Marinicrinis sediminis TaxID=1652465 RepID=A0ABW5RBB5_9BACL